MQELTNTEFYHNLRKESPVLLPDFWELEEIIENPKWENPLNNWMNWQHYILPTVQEYWSTLTERTQIILFVSAYERSMENLPD